ncbi:hypothetical protein BDQ12DRAFT_619143 [Crucibulum laeve]|uniref:T6SS Phospholipase effector Tle1-like catalytic domain-containing protein n=1 Tax=Crucibulum laeve TaxID=68775 RepID=A0A5C3LH90_9AGAR|nr:hypothetical protein BDQ12DRAFT_619143 [Crucibulum laeve]
MTTLDHRPVATRRGTPLDCDSKRNGRALIVSLDGTSNQFGEYNTNVVEIYHRIVKSERQRTYYNSGIGTYIAPASPWDRAVQFFYHNSNLVFAWDLKKHVLAAYRWLSENYQPGDRIYFFGFSRGAFQVRVLAGMIEKVGLLLPGNEEQIEFAYDLYKDLNSDPDNTQFYNMAARFKETFSHPGVHVYFVGVWDTVSSVGLFRNKQFPLTDTSEHICYFRHALALDERRVKFLPEYARGGSSYAESAGLDSAGLRPRPPRVKEVWFSGSHSDINTELSNGAVSAVWMGNEAITAGLDLKPSKVLWDWKSLREDMPTKSLGSVWWLAEFLPMNFLAYTGIRKTYW